MAILSGIHAHLVTKCPGTRAGSGLDAPRSTLEVSNPLAFVQNESSKARPTPC